MRELSSLVGLQVIATAEGKRLGTVADALIDLAEGRLVALTLSKAPEPAVILAEDIDVIGPDAVMIASSAKLTSGEEAAQALAHGHSVLTDPPTVITTRGARLGQLGPIQIDEGSRRIVRFEVSAGTLRDVTDGALALPVVAGTVHGEDTVILPHEVVARRIEHGGGLRGALRGLAARLRSGYVQVAERSEEALQEGGARLKVRAEEARKRAAELAKEAREKAEQVAEEAKEAGERAGERAGELARRARERAARAAEQVQEAIETEQGEAEEEPTEALPPETEEQAGSEEEEEASAIAPGAATPMPGRMSQAQGRPGSETADEEQERQEAEQ
ncbi:MAG: PRC-barrel domain-containing protein [Armatimonadota bacterium]